MNLINNILEEASNVLDKHIINPDTGNQIKVSSALTYDETSSVYKTAKSMVDKADTIISKKNGKKVVKANPKAKRTSKSTKAKPEKIKKTDTDWNNVYDKEATSIEKKSTPEKDPNSRSHKPKSASYGISKECSDFLKSKGYTGLNALPQSFVTIEEIKFNPALKTKGQDSVWVAQFPFMVKKGKDAEGNPIYEKGTKTVYTKGFMKKSQVKKYKKISKITHKDIVSLEEKTDKLLNAKDKNTADSAAVIGIILKTGLRIGSVDAEDSSTGNIGVRTLKADNVIVEGDKISFKFIGKSYQENIAEFEDPIIASYISKLKKDKQPTDNLFECSYGQVSKVMDNINPKGIHAKDLRTYKATEYAKQLLDDKSIAPPPLPTDLKQLKIVVKEKLAMVFEKVSKLLNNSPTMSRNSYVHPVVITDFLNNLGLTPKFVGYKHVTLPEAKQLKEEIYVKDFQYYFDKYLNNVTDEEIENDEYSENDRFDKANEYAKRMVASQTKNQLKEGILSSDEKQTVNNCIKVLKTTYAGNERQKAFGTILAIARTKTEWPITTLKGALLALDYIEPELQPSNKLVDLKSINLNEVNIDDVTEDMNSNMDDFYAKYEDDYSPTTIDEMFEQNFDYGDGIEYSDISEEDSDECEEYELPEWYDSSEWDLVPISDSELIESVIRKESAYDEREKKVQQFQTDSYNYIKETLKDLSDKKFTINSSLPHGYGCSIFLPIQYKGDEKSYFDYCQQLIKTVENKISNNPYKITIKNTTQEGRYGTFTILIPQNYTGLNEAVINRSVFTDSGSTFENSKTKIENELQQAKELKIKNDELALEWFNKSKRTKGDTTAFEKRNKDREIMVSWLEQASNFMSEFNTVYSNIKDKLISENPDDIKIAASELKHIYPYDLIKALGIIKIRSKRRYKIDSPLLLFCTNWGDAIINRYDILKDGLKNIGKSDNQINARSKQASNMRQRWGSY